MFLLIYITHPDGETARRITDTLIQQKLIACANIFPIKSAYWWQGTVERQGEVVSLVKTIPENWETIKTLVNDLHPYDTPCLLKMEVSANDAYEQWVRESCSD